jgi:hypothetical protein
MLWFSVLSCLLNVERREGSCKYKEKGKLTLLGANLSLSLDLFNVFMP